MDLGVLSQEIYCALNSELFLEHDHAWVVPSAHPEMLLTIIFHRSFGADFENFRLVFSLALGEFMGKYSDALSLEILSLNTYLSTINGPKLSYSEGCGMLTLVKSIDYSGGGGVMLAVSELILVGSEIRAKVIALGC